MEAFVILSTFDNLQFNKINTNKYSVYTKMNTLYLCVLAVITIIYLYGNNVLLEFALFCVFENELNISRNMPPYILVFIWSLQDRKHCEKIRYLNER